MSKRITTQDPANPYSARVKTHPREAYARIEPRFDPGAAMLARFTAKTALWYEYVGSGPEDQATILRITPAHNGTGQQLPFNEGVVTGAVAEVLRQLGGLASAERFDEIY